MLEMMSRRAIRGLIAIFTAGVLFFGHSLFWTSDVSIWMRLITVGVALLSYFRPHLGLLLLAVLAPLEQIGSRTLISQMRGAEVLVLSFLAGALMRGCTLHRFRDFPSNLLHIAALMFGMVIAASCVEQIWFLQIQRDAPSTFFGDLLTYGVRNYLTSLRGF